MEAPATRTTAATLLLLAVAGAATLAIVSSPGTIAQPDPAYLAAAEGAVLADEATPQPTIAPEPTAVFRPSATDHSVRDGTAAVSGSRMSADGVVLVITVPAPAAAATPVKHAKATTKPTTKTTTAKTTHAAPAKTAAPVHYQGVNHVWIPALGINKSVASFPCSRVAPPDNLMYRWGCAGTNNVYLLGHAYAPMKPLYNAYNRGTLKVGMRAIYADGAGVIHTYAIIWWKITLPTTEASWAWAPQSVPSMTLQTCVGAHSEYRLMVRLEELAN